jgi:hypothetical protein
MREGYDLRRHLTYANVMATIGVFLALGGVSYAAIKLPANSVGAKQIKSGAVGSSEIANHSIKPGDFKGSSLPSGPRGPRGPQGDRGPAAAKYWAQLSGGASTAVANGSDGVTAARDPANNLATVTFPTDVSKCATVLTITGGLPGRTIRKATSSSSGPKVAVWVSFVDGAGNTTTTTDSFDIAVFC